MRYKNVDGVQTQMTPEEEAAFDAEVQANSQPKVPTEIPAYKGLLIIDQFNMTAAYEAWASDPERTFAEKAFIQRDPTWKRQHPVLLAGAAAMGLSDHQLDQMFIAAAAL